MLPGYSNMHVSLNVVAIVSQSAHFRSGEIKQPIILFAAVTNQNDGCHCKKVF